MRTLGRQHKVLHGRSSKGLTKDSHTILITPKTVNVILDPRECLNHVHDLVVTRDAACTGGLELETRLVRVRVRINRVRVRVRINRDRVRVRLCRVSGQPHSQGQNKGGARSTTRHVSQHMQGGGGEVVVCDLVLPTAACVPRIQKSPGDS